MNDISIPEKMQGRPLFRGMPIPFSAYVDPNGVPDFRVLKAEDFIIGMVSRNQCGLCGGTLDNTLWFIGGPKCVEFGCFTDWAMHIECVSYAAKVCPFLVGKTDYAKLSNIEKRHGEGKTAVVSGSISTAPSKFFLFKTEKVSVFRHEHDIVFLIPEEERVEGWATELPSEPTERARILDKVTEQYADR